MIARPELRPVVLVGDGAFQMTGMELSTIVKHRLSPIIIVLDNQGYGTERLLHPGDHKFNDVHPWQYQKLPEVLGGGTGYEVRTEAEFDRALRSAWADTSGMSLIRVHLRKTISARRCCGWPGDFVPGCERLSRPLATRRVARVYLPIGPRQRQEALAGLLCLRHPVRAIGHRVAAICLP